MLWSPVKARNQVYALTRQSFLGQKTTHQTTPGCDVDFDVLFSFNLGQPIIPLGGGRAGQQHPIRLFPAHEPPPEGSIVIEKEVRLGGWSSQCLHCDSLGLGLREPHGRVIGANK